MGKTFRESMKGAWLGKKYHIGNAYSFLKKQKLFLSVNMDDTKSGWKEADFISYVEEIDEER